MWIMSGTLQEYAHVETQFKQRTQLALMSENIKFLKFCPTSNFPNYIGRVDIDMSICC